MAAASIPVVLLALAVLSQTDANEELRLRSREALQHEERVTVSALSLLYQMSETEARQRLYLLTESPEHLADYRQWVTRVQTALSTFVKTTAGDDPAELERLALTRQLTARRMAMMEGVVELARTGRRTEAIARLDEGPAAMLDLRREINSHLTAASQRQAAVAAESEQLAEHARRLQNTLAVVTIVALIIVMMTLALERLSAQRAKVAQARMNEALVAARVAADDANSAKSRFLATASHDLRQPLHALALYISALDRRVESPQAREILANMDGAVRAMTRMFAALLDLARLEAGALTPEPIAFPLGELLEDVARQSVDPNAHGDLEVRVVDTGVHVFSDPDLLEIALRNLASNAVKHSRGGKVLLGCRRIGDEVRIEVHDDGQGIAKDQVQRLFSEFVRGDQAGSTEGIGLGLAIVERMSKLLGHKLAINSVPGCGTVFSITVPRAAPAAEPAAAPAAVSLQGLRLLVADDEPLALDAMRRSLEDLGAQVTACDSAAQIRAHSAEPFDLYVFDLNLRGDNGLELLEEVETARNTPVAGLIVTGATTSEALEQLRRTGREWVTKPISAATLSSAALRVLAQRAESAIVSG